MQTIRDHWEFWQKLLTMLEQQFGPHCEIILHDLTGDYAHTIVDIRNGHITGRKVGDCGSNLGLEVLRGTVRDGDRYNYVVHTPDGKILRSSTMFLKNDEGRVIGSLCINLDITQSVAFEGFLHQCNGYTPGAPAAPGKETFDGDINGVLEFLLQQATDLAGKPVEELSREEKIRFVGYLDAKGAFLVTKSSERVCEYLKISRFTLYNYLEMVRKNRERDSSEEDKQP